MANGYLIEGMLATIGSILIFIALKEWLANIGILREYWWLLGVIGFIMVWFRGSITRKIGVT